MKILRFCVVLGLLLVLIYIFYDAVSAYRTEPASFGLSTFTEGRKIAVNLKTQANAEWRNLTVLLMGFLWVILIAQRTEFTKIRIKYLTEIILFIFANISYLLSLSANYIWRSRVIATYWYANIQNNKGKSVEVPDIFSEHIDSFSNAQFNFFLFGIATTALLILLARFTTNKSDDK